jgi:chromosomal replication initiation ATPase DnaA
MQRILAQLELQITRFTFDAWLQDSEAIDCREGVLIVAVPDRRAKGWLAVRLMPTIERTVERTIGARAKAVRVEFVVR